MASQGVYSRRPRGGKPEHHGRVPGRFLVLQRRALHVQRPGAGSLRDRQESAGLHRTNHVTNHQSKPRTNTHAHTHIHTHTHTHTHIHTHNNPNTQTHSHAHSSPFMYILTRWTWASVTRRSRPSRSDGDKLPKPCTTPCCRWCVCAFWGGG